MSLRWLRTIVAGLMFAVAFMCGEASAGVNVVASIKPVQSLAASVMRGVGEPGLIVGGNQSPHTYSMKPSDAAALQKADVVLWVGESLEAFLEKPLETLPAGATVVELARASGVRLLKVRDDAAFEAHAHEDAEEGPGHDHGHEVYDPHIWLDPVNAKAMVHAIAEALAKADPANSDAYRNNAQDTMAALDDLAAELGATLQPVRGKPYLVFHDAYQYFDERFAVPATGSITVSPEAAPGAKRVRQIRDRISSLGAACVFSEPQFEPRLVSVIIEGTAARAGVLDPLGAALPEGPDQYFELMRAMARSMRDCLAPAG